MTRVWLDRRHAIEAAIAALKPAEQLAFKAPVGDVMHHILVMLTDKDGLHSGRPRFLVACTTCMTLLHEATTGPVAQVDYHAREIGCPS